MKAMAAQGIPYAVAYIERASSERRNIANAQAAMEARAKRSRSGGAGGGDPNAAAVVAAQQQAEQRRRQMIMQAQQQQQQQQRYTVKFGTRQIHVVSSYVLGITSR